MFDRNTRIREIMHLPGITALIERHTGQKMSPTYLKLGANVTLQKAGAYMRWNDEQLDAVIEEINGLAAGTEGGGR